MAWVGLKVNCSQQYAALEDLYYSTNGDGWNNRGNWLNGDPTFQGWNGIKAKCVPGAACCQVIRIELQRNKLVGMLVFSHLISSLWSFCIA
jgi:hypothetical protein